MRRVSVPASARDDRGRLDYQAPRTAGRAVAMVVKLVLVVRTDLDMGRGKIAAQAAHAAVTAVLASAETDDFVAWLSAGQPKVVLRAESGDELTDIVRRARAAGLSVELVRDAGRTQLAPGTATCCAIGPADGQSIDAVTGQLRLL